MKRPTVLALLALASCESPEAPAACDDAIAEVTVNAGETTTAAACFSDQNGDVLSYSAVSSDSGVATASVSDTTVTVRAIAPGKATVTVTASDPGGLQGKQTFSVTVPNRAPQPKDTMPSIAVHVGQTETVDASPYFTEPDGEALAYTAASSSPAVVAVSVAGSTVTVTAVAPGSASVTVTASDPGGLEGEQSFSVTVPNRAPQPKDTMPSIAVHVGQTETVDASPYFTEPDGETLVYSAISSDPDVATVSVSVSMVTVKALAGGTSSVTVTARDPGGLAATQTFQVTVPNRPQRLTNEGGDWPVWSPDGEKIVFMSDRDQFEAYDIYVMDADGGNEERLTDSGGEWPKWSPDGERIVFMSDRDGDNADIYVIDADGGNEERLTDSGGEFPAWSPDGDKIVFTSDRDGDYDIYVMDADGGNEERLTEEGGWTSVWPPDGVWSADGEKIVFMSGRDGDELEFDIYVMDADGDNEERLTEEGGWTPVWSADGEKIVFMSDRDGDELEFDIYVIDADGDNEERLTNDGGWYSVWSPDGEKIVFMSDRDGDELEFDIYVIDADGDKEERLTEEGGWAPAWSPDGEKIAFQSYRDGDDAFDFDIYVIQIN